MDPKAALDAAEEALESGDKAEAREYLANYASWRRNGGFQPAGGDARHASLLKRLRSRKRVSKNVGSKSLAATEALGWEPDDYQMARAEEEYAGVPTASLRATLRAAERKFAKTGGRGVDLADEIDAMRIALAVRGVSKNGSRKARLRRNADGGPNFLLWGGLVVGGYLAYRWLTDRSGKAAARPAPVVAASAAKAPAAPALPAPPAAAPVPTASEAWAAGLAANKGQPPQFTEQQFTVAFGTLTNDEKRLFVEFMSAVGSPTSASALPAVMSNPNFAPMMRKLEAAAPSRRASSGTSGIGNYCDDGE